MDENEMDACPHENLVQEVDGSYCEDCQTWIA